MERRLTRIERRFGSPERHQLAVCEEHEWPPSAWAELLAADAVGDQVRIAELAERFAGVRPVFDTGYTAMVFTHCGPPEEARAAVLEAERRLPEERDPR